MANDKETAGSSIPVEAAPQETAPGADQRGQWFVVHTLSQHEKKVRDSINRQIKLNDQVGVYEAYIPEEKVEDIRLGKKNVKNRKFFPGYVLVRMDLYREDGSINEDAWYFVRSVQGVLGFLGTTNRGSSANRPEGNRPRPLPPEEVAYVLRPPENPRPKDQFKVGETVRIKDGAFENIEGKIQSIDNERGKLQLMVSILGRSTPLELEFWQVEHVV